MTTQPNLTMPLDMGAWTVTAEAIRNRYAEITNYLGIASPPQFLIVPRKTLNRNIGEHRRNQDGSFSIVLADDRQDPYEIDFVLVHELTHHVLHRCGYFGSGHAWPMLALEKILFNKLGWDIDSIIQDVNRTWPRCTFRRTCSLNVDHAIFLSDGALADTAVMLLPSHEIGKWVLNQPPEHEPKLFQLDIGKKLREMHHAFIADRRRLFFLAKWTTFTLLSAGVMLLFISAIANVKCLGMVGVVALVVALLLVIVTGLTLSVRQVVHSVWRSVHKVFRMVVEKAR